MSFNPDHVGWVLVTVAPQLPSSGHARCGVDEGLGSLLESNVARGEGKGKKIMFGFVFRF